MKDLYKSEVYDLRGITLEQSKELYRWLKANDKGRSFSSYESFHEEALNNKTGLRYSIKFGWGLYLNSIPKTVKIQELFEDTYGYELKHAKEQLEHYKREVDRLENESKPKVGDVFRVSITSSEDLKNILKFSRYERFITIK